LLLAAEVGHVDIVRTLLGCSAKGDVYAQSGRSVPDIAAIARHMDVEEVLRAAQAKRTWSYWLG
jgi:hypothetical protein